MKLYSFSICTCKTNEFYILYKIMTLSFIKN